MVRYQLTLDGSARSWDLALAVCTLQGLINRSGPRLYIETGASRYPSYWLDVMSRPGYWLADKPWKQVHRLDDLVALAGPVLKGAILWDPNVPASVNVATTMAGVHDAVVLHPELHASEPAFRNLPVLHDLRGRFTGAETGSAKNDAYRWVIREYLQTGRCSSRFIFLYEDSWGVRDAGDAKYVVTRDWAVFHRGFVFDLSPWGDETPADDRKQRLGLDRETYTMLLEALLRQSRGRHMTELAGFFHFSKYSNVPPNQSRHEPVPTEWETVWLISPYNAYQNTVAHGCYNQSFHRHAPRRPLKQRTRPVRHPQLTAKTWMCVLMADYDSTTPLYEFMPDKWDNGVRGQLPLLWGINPNLMDTYPDIFTHLWSTASPNDVFGADASCAGYTNPNRIRPEYLPLFTRHCQHYYRATDISLSPMVLDQDEPSPAVKDAFARFSPDGFATIVQDEHNQGGKHPTPHVWRGMPVTVLRNDACHPDSVEMTAAAFARGLAEQRPDRPGFLLYRVVWQTPEFVQQALAIARRKHPQIEVELINPYSWFALLKQHLTS